MTTVSQLGDFVDAVIFGSARAVPPMVAQGDLFSTHRHSPNAPHPPDQQLPPRCEAPLQLTDKPLPGRCFFLDEEVLN
jgi:hypothetical protein